jgi:hypothetical protein
VRKGKDFCDALPVNLVMLYLEDFCSFVHPYVCLHFRESILEIIKEGRIVPSEITVELISKAMEMSNSKRVLIDGFPRCEENRIPFERIVTPQLDHYSLHYYYYSSISYLLTQWLSKLKRSMLISSD